MGQLAIDAAGALGRLRQGNAAFVAGGHAPRASTVVRGRALARGQEPFAAVVTCSDSRVSPELYFAQGLGHVFVVRTAGNVVDAVALGSIEYAVAYLGVPLVVVVGHTDCGAVRAALEGGDVPGSIGSIVGAIAANVAPAGPGCALRHAIELNVRATVSTVEGSPVLAETAGRVRVHGAVCDIASGKVRFLRPPRTL